MTHHELITQMLPYLADADTRESRAIITAAREYLAAPDVEQDDQLSVQYAKLAQHCAMLEAKLAAPEQSEPVAWYDEDMDSAYTAGELDGGKVHGLVPLYTYPAPKAEPDDKDLTIAYMAGYHKGKTDAQPKAEQSEPICYASINKQGDVCSTLKQRDSWRTVPLYTADQLAAAVLREREQCAAIAEAADPMGSVNQEWMKERIAAAIRGQQ